MHALARNAALAAVLCLCLPLACGGSDVHPAQPAAPVASAEPASTTATSAPPSESGTNLSELVTGNVATTDLSALVRVTAVRVEGPGGAPPATTGYVNDVYDVEIVTCLYGCGSAKTITVGEMAEAGFKPHPAGTMLVVSVCRGDAGKYHTPDVGYLIPASEVPPSMVSALAAKPPPRGASVCTP
jgi:hypothetical protein